MILIYLAVYVILIMGISYWFSLKNSTEDFIIAGRNRPQWQIIISKVAVSMGTGFFLIYTAYTYQYGWSALLLLLFFTISYFTFAFWAVPKIYRYSREKKFVTMGDYVAHHFSNKKIGKLLDLITVVVIFVWILSTFIGGAKILSLYLSITYGGAVLITLILVGGYTLLSGYRAVLITDVVQSIIIFGLLVMALIGLLTQANWQDISSTLTEPFPPAILIGIAVFGFFSTFSSADRYQLVYSARSLKTAVRGTAWGIIPFAAAFIPIIIIGLFMRSQVPGIDPDTAFLYFINNFTSSNYFNLAAVMLVAGLMSTMDSWIYAIASHLKGGGNGVASNDVSILRRNIFLTSIVLAISAFFFRDLLSIAILGAIVMVTTSLPMIYVFSNGAHGHRFTASLLGSVGAAILGVLIFGSVPEVLVLPVIGGLLGLVVPIRWLYKIGGKI